MLAREDIARIVADLFGGRVVRWLPDERARGDYDGRDRTLEVFDVDVADQLSLLRRMRPMRPRLERAAGGAIVVLFHTPSETARLYPELMHRRAAVRSPRS